RRCVRSTDATISWRSGKSAVPAKEKRLKRPNSRCGRSTVLRREGGPSGSSSFRVRGGSGAMAVRITFGTDGWRAVMAREFTFDNVRRVAAAVARYVEETRVAERGLLVGYDARFLSEHFAAEIARVLMDRGISVAVV